MSWAYIQTKDKFDGPAFGGLVYKRKNISIWNLLNLLLFFLFSRFCKNQQPQVLRTMSQAATTCSKSGIETPEEHCMKYAQRRAFPDSFISVYGQNCIHIFPYFIYEKIQIRERSIFWHISCRARCEICLKLTIETQDYVKLVIELTLKMKSKSFWSL